MTFRLNSVAAAATLCLGLAGAGSAATSVVLATSADWVPASGMTAVNTATTSTLSRNSSTLTFEAAFEELLLDPGSSMNIVLGTVTPETLDPVEQNSFRGASLQLTIFLLDPGGASPEVLNADAAGELALFGGQVDLGWQTPQTVEFDTAAGAVTVSVEAVTSVFGGFGSVDINATASLVSKVPPASGDLDGDGLVTVVDAVFALRIVGGLDAANAPDPAAADMDLDGFIRLNDAGAIIRAAS